MQVQTNLTLTLLIPQKFGWAQQTVRAVWKREKVMVLPGIEPISIYKRPSRLTYDELPLDGRIYSSE
jgi:hypothetical protein